MRRDLILILASTLLAGTTLVPAAQGDEFKPLISFNELAGIDPRSHSPFLAIFENRLLDARPRGDYDAGHIPGAIWVDLAAAQAIAARPGGLTDRAAWLDWIAPLGIFPVSQVRIVGDDRQLGAARLWWLLRYLGVEKVGLVNGNFALWKAQRRAVTTDLPEFTATTFPVDFQTNRLATRDEVLAALKANDAQVVDARSADEWVGKQVRAKRGGHIPTACRVEWVDLVDNDGRFLPADPLRTKLKAAGVKPGEPVITHCQSGGRASVDAFVFEMLGYPTRNYYLSWADWGNAEETPITTEEKSAPEQPAADQTTSKPFTVEYYYKCKWGKADEFLSLFQRNHLPILEERKRLGQILQLSMTKPRFHAVEAGRWDYRVTIVFKDVAASMDPAAETAAKEHLAKVRGGFDQSSEPARFATLDAHWDVPIEDVDMARLIKAP